MLIGLILTMIGCFVFSLLGFLGKNVIVDDFYIKASKEKQAKMNKTAYRIQGSIVFLLFALSMLCNLLRALTTLPLFTYLAVIIAASDMVYLTVSHFTLKHASEGIADMFDSAIPHEKPIPTEKTIPPMEKPHGFSFEEDWVTDIKALTTQEVCKRYLDADEEWTPDYRYLCYMELLARQPENAG